MRVDPRDFCGLQLGEAKVIRNAGGRTFDAKRSLAVMGTIAPLAMIVVVHHTDCGGLCTTDEQVHLRLRERAPSHAHEIKYAIWHLFLHRRESSSGRGRIKNWHFLAKDADRGVCG
ncbi:hypothetical protein VD0002_g9094 [Verticillium dahliae]|uniref:Carbonic anhydrase n=1 Tax=Verticillium dahliae TaxID=27337 RepID=A0AA44WQN9_VERDA|nr:hypothetical protein BJF96_g1766 [Verticillium dahliae]PNH52299.1 hypothetical protein VD0003_g4982 [Verticillium dahliae]PNH58433.1 hypothetical protein VD0002_g9094 [Verticillium dahliae]